MNRQPTVTSSGPPYIAAGARRDAGADGWVLGSRSLAVTRNGGRSWTELPLPATAPSIVDVSVLSRKTVAVVASRSADTLRIAVLADDASRWQEQRVSVDMPVGSAQVVAQGGHLAGVMVTGEAGSNWSWGSWLRTPEAGVSWHAQRAPVGGQVTDMGGTLWLVGGVADASVYTSGDDGSTWQKVSLPMTPLGGAPAAFGPVQEDVKHLVVTATTTHSTEVITGASGASGWQWTAGPVLSLGGEYGTGAPAVTSVAGGVLWVLSPANEMARVTLATGHVTTVKAVGLPANGTIELHATSGTSAWATYATQVCHGGKRNCASVTGIAATADGGATWDIIRNPPTA